MTEPRVFTAIERIEAQPVWSNEYDLNTDWSPTSPLLDEARTAAWWTPDAITTVRSA